MAYSLWPMAALSELKLPTFNKAAIGHPPLAIGRFFHLNHQLLTFVIGNPLRLVRFAVEIHHHGVAQGLDFARFSILQALLHLEAGVAHLRDAALTDDGIVEMDGLAEIEVHVDEDIFEGQPIDFGLEDMLEVAASTHVEEVALRPVVDVVVRVEVAHADLDGTGKHISYI